LAAAAGGGVFFAALAAGDIEEAPGVFVFFQEAFAGDDAAVAAAGSVGVEAEAFAEAGGFDGDDVPEVERGDPSTSLRTGSGGDEVGFFGSVDGEAVAAVFDAVAAVGEEFGAFHLNAVEAAVAVVDDEVVAFGLSPGSADAEAHAGGAGEEGGFGGFSAALARGLGDGVEGDGLRNFARRWGRVGWLDGLRIWHWIEQGRSDRRRWGSGFPSRFVRWLFRFLGHG
jgi:hypothetical protein